MAPITGEIPVNTALNERASFRYSLIIIGRYISIKVEDKKPSLHTSDPSEKS